MMLSSLFGSVLDDLTAFSPAEVSNRPTVDWVIGQTIRLLQQYPSGVSRPVLLTELEHRWRMYLKRGEHVGKLKQAIVTKQLSLTDTFTGDLTPIDEYRCTFSADGVSCTMILHRQWFDWMMFLQSVGVESVNGRRCLFTQCRMLKLTPPVLLPTPMSVILLRLHDALEAFLVQDVFLMMHELFAGRFVDPHVHIRKQQQHTFARVLTLQETHGCCAGSDQVALPDNSETLVVCAEVIGCSSVRQYQQQSLGGGGGGAQYQLITLRLLSSSSSSSSHVSSGTDDASKKASCIAYLILFDDQVAMSRLWNNHDRLILYRPYLRANAEEERLFGATKRTTEHGLAHAVVERPDPCLFEFLPSEPDNNIEVFANYHMLYGSVSVICKIENESSGSGSVPAAAAAAASAAASAAARSALLPLHQSSTSSSGVIQVGDRNVSVVGTVLSLRSIPLPLPALPTSSRDNGSNSDDDSDGVVEMWVHCAASSACKSAPSRSQQLLRIRSRSKSFLTADAKESDFSSIGPITTGGAVQAGQSVFFSSGINVISACPLSAVASEAQQQRGGLCVSANQVQSWVAGLGGDSSVPVLNCVWGRSSSILFQASVPSAVAVAVEDANSSVSSEDCKIIPLCCLPALACSPSLFLPTPLVAAISMSVVTAGLSSSASAGCLLVQASIQPMHPSVRVQRSANTNSNSNGDKEKDKDQQHVVHEASNNSFKRQRTDNAAEGATRSNRTEQGYQLMRLRDGSGEVLCVIESTVEQSTSAGGELTAVRHRLVNTSSTLFFDNATGQLVRAPSTATTTSSNVGAAATATDGLAALSGPMQYAMLLSRIDDPTIESPLLYYLRSQHQQQQSKSIRSSPLPMFRIETICDALPPASL